MAENRKSNNKNLMSKTPQKPNYQVWIILVLFVLVFAVTYFNNSNSSIEITKHRFEKMLLAGDVQDVVIIPNRKYVEVSLKESALSNSKYNTELEKDNPFSLSGGPQYKITIVDAQDFATYMEQLETQIPEDQRIGYSVEERSDLKGIFFQWGFLFFPVLFLILV